MGPPFHLISNIPFLISVAATFLASVGDTLAFGDTLAQSWTNGPSLYTPEQGQGDSR